MRKLFYINGFGRQKSNLSSSKYNNLRQRIPDISKSQGISPVDHAQLTWQLIQLWWVSRQTYLLALSRLVIPLSLNYTYLIFQDFFRITKGSLLVKRNTHKCSFFQEILATLLLIIAVCHSPLKIKIMTLREVTTAPFSTKEPGGTRIVTNRISMVYIAVAITPPAVMEWTGFTGKDIITPSRELRWK